MKASQDKKKDTIRVIHKLEDVILQHREYFATWRAHRWSEFDQSVKKREELRKIKK